MAEPLAHEVGLLRTIARNLERTHIPVDPRVLALWRAQGNEVPSGDQTWKTTICPAGHDAFNQLSECLVALFPAMERGVNFAIFQNELFTQLEAYVGCDPAAIAGADTADFHAFSSMAMSLYLPLSQGTQITAEARFPSSTGRLVGYCACPGIEDEEARESRRRLVRPVRVNRDRFRHRQSVSPPRDRLSSPAGSIRWRRFDDGNNDMGALYDVGILPPIPSLARLLLRAESNRIEFHNPLARNPAFDLGDGGSERAPDLGPSQALG